MIYPQWRIFLPVDYDRFLDRPPGYRHCFESPCSDIPCSSQNEELWSEGASIPSTPALHAPRPPKLVQSMALSRTSPSFRCRSEVQDSPANETRRQEDQALLMRKVGCALFRIFFGRRILHTCIIIAERKNQSRL